MTTAPFPRMVPMGLTGLLVSFADTLSEPANRAALAFCKAAGQADWPGLVELSTTLCSVFVRFDPQATAYDTLCQGVQRLLDTQDWFQAPLPEGRKLWRIPTAYGTDLAPQLTEAATLAGVTPAQAIAELSAAPVRVLALGFAPGQPYLGTLPPHWDLPRQTALTNAVPIGALVVAVRQFVLFATRAPTGWRHVGQTGFIGYRPDLPDPFPLRPGDECQFVPVAPDVLHRLIRDDPAGQGGALCEPLS